MEIKEKKLKSKVQVKLLKKFSTRIEKNGTKTEKIEELSKVKDK